MKRGLHIIGWMILCPALLLGSEVVKSERDLARQYGLMSICSDLQKAQVFIFYGSDGVRRACYRCRHKSRRRYCNQVVQIHDIDRHVQQLHSKEFKK